MADYHEVNGAYWDDRVAAHAASPSYGVALFAQDPQHLSEVVRFDRPRLGDIAGLDAVHLQCHIGTDTVSLGRLGANMEKQRAEQCHDVRFGARHRIGHGWRTRSNRVQPLPRTASMEPAPVTHTPSLVLEGLFAADAPLSAER